MYWWLWVGKVQWGLRCDVQVPSLLQTRHWYLQVLGVWDASQLVLLSDLPSAKRSTSPKHMAPPKNSPMQARLIGEYGSHPLTQGGAILKATQLQIIIVLAEATVGTESVVQLPPSAPVLPQPSESTCLHKPSARISQRLFPRGPAAAGRERKRGA